MAGRTHEGDTANSVYKVEPLHNVPFLIDECCNLINKEWKRSLAARKRSIENSSENFPMSLLLINTTGKLKVVGHCKISKLNNSNSNIFVETVVIHPDLRGQGLGRFLMNHVEEVARRKNIKWIYLSTRGQEVFYEKLGYSKCSPVNIYGGQPYNSSENIKQIEEKSSISLSKLTISTILHPDNNSPSPPPPPPLPSSLLSTPKSSYSTLSHSKTYMKKEVIY